MIRNYIDNLMIYKGQKWLSLTFALLLFALFYNLHLGPVRGEEPRRMIIAMEMVESGNWWATTQMGKDYVHKPPLYNWLIAAGIQLFNNSHVFIARAITALANITLALSLYFFCHRRFSVDQALRAALFIVVAVDWLFYGSFQGEIDILFTTFCWLSMAALFNFFDGHLKVRQSLPFTALFFVLAFWTKGTPVLVLFGLLFIALCCVPAYRQKIAQIPVLAYAALALLGLAAYYYRMYELGVFEKTISAQVGQATTRSSQGQFEWTMLLQPIELIGILLYTSIPATLVLAGRGFWTHRNRLWQHPVFRVLLICLALNTVFYMVFPGTRTRYLYPLFPIIILIGAYTWRWSWPSILQRVLRPILMICAIGLCLATAYVIYGQLGIDESIVAVGIAAILLFALQRYKKSSHSHWQFIVILLLCARVLYSCVIPHQREVDSQGQAQRLVAEQVHEQVEGQTVHILCKERCGPWFNLGAVYYLSQLQGVQVQLREQAVIGQYYFVRPEFELSPNQERLGRYKFTHIDMDLIYNAP